MKKISITNFISRIRGEVSINELINRGLIIGNNFKCLNQVIIDDSHPWLIEIGDDVTLAPRVHILAHDASTKAFLGYTKIGQVKIGNRVFIGAGTVILPGITIGNDVIVGANSTVTHDILDGMVVAGCPAKVISTTEKYLEKEKKRMEIAPCYGEEFTMRGNISEERKQQQRDDLVNGQIGYVD